MITNFPAGQLKWINSGQVDHILFTVHNKGGEAYKISKGAIITQMKGLHPNARLLTLYPILDTLSSALSEMPFLWLRPIHHLWEKYPSMKWMLCHCVQHIRLIRTWADDLRWQIDQRSTICIFQKLIDKCWFEDTAFTELWITGKALRIHNIG